MSLTRAGRQVSFRDAFGLGHLLHILHAFPDERDIQVRARRRGGALRRGIPREREREGERARERESERARERESERARERESERARERERRRKRSLTTGAITHTQCNPQVAVGCVLSAVFAPIDENRRALERIIQDPEVRPAPPHTSQPKGNPKSTEREPKECLWPTFSLRAVRNIQSPPPMPPPSTAGGAPTRAARATPQVCARLLHTRRAPAPDEDAAEESARAVAEFLDWCAARAPPAPRAGGGRRGCARAAVWKRDALRHVLENKKGAGSRVMWVLRRPQSQNLSLKGASFNDPFIERGPFH